MIVPLIIGTLHTSLNRYLWGLLAFVIFQTIVILSSCTIYERNNPINNNGYRKTIQATIQIIRGNLRPFRGSMIAKNSSCKTESIMKIGGKSEEKENASN